MTKVPSNILLHRRPDYAPSRVGERERKTLGEGRPAPFFGKQSIAIKEPWGPAADMPSSMSERVPYPQ
jgi:hypothetical protein